MNRRAWLGLCIGAFSSGCLGLRGPRKKKIAWIRLTNTLDTARDIDVRIERDGTTVFSEHYQLGTSPEHATVRIEDPIDSVGRYSLYVDTGDQVAHLHPSEFSDIGISERCIGIRYTLHDRGTTGFEFEPVQNC